MNRNNLIYTPQKGAGADKYSPDCSMITLGMMQTYGLLKGWTVDQAFANILNGQAPRGIFPNELRDWLRSKGLMCDWVDISTPEVLYGFLRSKRPVTFMVNYSYWVNAGITQFVDFTGLHFVIATGIEINPKDDNKGEDAIICMDPYHSDGLGNNVVVPTGVLFKSISNGVGLVPALPIQNLAVPTGATYRIVDACTYCINVRAQASDGAAKLGVIDRKQKDGTYTPVHIVKAAAAGAKVYVQLADGPYSGGWVWWPYLTLMV